MFRRAAIGRFLARQTDTDVIVVGAGIAGLVAGPTTWPPNDRSNVVIVAWRPTWAAGSRPSRQPGLYLEHGWPIFHNPHPTGSRRCAGARRAGPWPTRFMRTVRLVLLLGCSGTRAAGSNVDLRLAHFPLRFRPRLDRRLAAVSPTPPVRWGVDLAVVDHKRPAPWVRRGRPHSGQPPSPLNASITATLNQPGLSHITWQ